MWVLYVLWRFLVAYLTSGLVLPSVRVCGVGYGSLVVVRQVRSSSGTFTEQVGGGFGWWWVVRVKFPDTLQSVFRGFMFCD